MPINEFLPFGTSVSANVQPQGFYAGSAPQINGFSSGIVPSAVANKAWRQGNFGTAALAEYMTRINLQDARDNGDLMEFLSKFWLALLGGGYFVDTGVPGSLLVATPAGLTFGAPFAGLTVNIKTAYGALDSSQFNWCGNGLLPIVYPNGRPISVGAYDPGSLITLRFDGVHWQLVAGGTTLRFTTGNPVIYVRPDGNDAHDGSTNTAGGAVLTLARAYQIAATYFVVGGVVTVQLGISTYASAFVPAMVSPLVVRGDIASPASYRIHGSGATNIAASSGSGNSNLSLIGVTVINDDSSNNLLTAANGGDIALAYVALGAVGNANVAAALACFPGGSITLGLGVTLNSNFGIGLSADGGNITLQAGGTLAAAGGPAFSNASVVASDSGTVQLSGTISGVASGVRYRVSSNGVIDTFGGGPSAIFGTSPGVNNGTGGQYV